MRFFSSKHLYAALITIVIVMPFVLAGQSSVSVGNAAPVFEDGEGSLTPPNDGWSSEASPTKVGNEITFTATATDANGDDYYLAICKTDAITPRGILPPQCDGGAWAANDFPVKSGQTEILTYQVQQTDPAVNEWYAFVCDAVGKNSQCSEASQGSGDSGSPFYTPEQTITVLRFGSDCPDLAELSELEAPDPDAGDTLAEGFDELQEPLSRNEIRQMIEVELEKDEGETISPKLKLARDRVDVLKALKKEEKLTDTQKDAVADYLLNKRSKLQKLASKNVRFCVVAEVEGEGLSDVVDKKDKTIQVKNSHQIVKKGFDLDFRNDEKRSIGMRFLERSFKERPILKADDSVLQAEGPSIEYKDPDSPNKLTTIEPAGGQTPEREDTYYTVNIHHETFEEEKGFGDMLMGIFDGEDVPGGTAFRMNVIEATPVVDPIVDPIVDPMGAAEEEVIYQSADNRKTDIYKYINEPTSVTPHEIKNYTLYNYGDGNEEELYTIDNAVLHMRDDGVIEGYYFEGVDLSQVDGAQDADGGLLERASRVMALEYAKDLHENGGPNPDFTIPAPFALDRDNNVLETLTYEIAGGNYNQLKVSFTAEPEAYPLALDPTLLFTAPGADNTSEHIIGESSARFGWSVIIGDMDNDGDDDLAVGGPTGSTNGRVYIFYNDGSYDSNPANADTIITATSSIWFGGAMALGDMNSDGQKDLIVGGRYYSTSRGAVYIFYNDNGFDATMDQTDADHTILATNQTTYTYFGDNIKVGDMDSDGDDDLIVGGHRYNSYQGRVYMFYQDGSIPTTAATADVIITGNAASYFGYDVEVGDLDGDGDDDLVVTADHDNTSVGAAYIFNNDGAYPTTAGTADITITGEASSYFGSSAAVGDLDGDGDDDLAVGARGASFSAGRVYIFNNDGSIPTTAATADKIITGEASSRLGYSTAIGDLNADGKDDLIGGAYYYSSYAGRIYAFYNTGAISGYTTTAATADVIITGPADSYLSYMKDTMAIGDLNADGTNDLAVGAIKYGGDYTGQAFVFYGEGGLEHRNTITGESASLLGMRMATGDMDADGTTDLVVSAPFYSTYTGRVYIFYNDGSLPTTAATADETITGENTMDLFSVLAIGDLDADGDDDLAVGAYGYDGSHGQVYIFYNDGSAYPDASAADETIYGSMSSDQFGIALATGDFDADGDIDLAASKNVNTGEVYIFYNDGTYTNVADSADDRFVGENSGDSFGISLAAADVDTDGDTDLIVGAEVYSTSTGRVYMFYNDGAIYPDAASADIIITGENTGDKFGNSLYTGDLDSDGTADLVAGAYTYGSNQGRAYIFYQDGIWGTVSCTTACLAANSDVKITGEGADDYFGVNLIIDDINHDGDDDLAVAAHYYDVGSSTEEGRVYIFYNDGSYATTAATADAIITGDPDNNLWAFATGDLNADGTTDLAVGAPFGTGYVYIFYGDSDYSWQTLYPYPQSFGNPWYVGQNYTMTVEGTQSSQELGKAFASGDFDGDGTTDLAVGAPAYNSNQGRVYIFLNDGIIGTDDSGADVVITGNTSQMFGFSLAAGKISETQDIIDDLYIGAPTNGSTGSAYTYIFNGRTSWNSSYAYSDNSNTIAWSPTAGNRCGHAVAVGDVGGDGRDDVIYGCSGYSTNKGIVFTANNDGTYPTTYDDYCYPSASTTEKFGSSLAIGDVDGDGDDDIVGGAPGYSSDTGQVHVCYNDGNYGTNTDFIITGTSAGDDFGTSVAVGELSESRDNKIDILVGAPGCTTDNGNVYIFYNDGSMPTTAGTADETLTGSTSYRFGQSVATGDINRDGRTDFIAGAPGATSSTGFIYGYFNDGAWPSTASGDYMKVADNTSTYSGYAVHLADITNNGWNEIIGGGYGHDSSKGSFSITDMGVAKIRYNAAGEFGSAITTGDFNGDGRKDLAVGAPLYNSSQGRVYVFFDDATNIKRHGVLYYSDIVDITITGEANDMFGSSLAAGPIGYDNSDLIDDLLIGAPTTGSATGTPTAAVYVFEGGTSGMGNAEACTSSCTYTSNNDELAYSSAYGDLCGTNVAVGDVDNDGVMDTIHSCPGFSTNRGIIFTNTPTDGYTDSFDDYAYCASGHTNECGYGLTVGDMDSDGDDDIVFGAPGYNSEAGAVHIMNNDGDYGALDTTIAGETAGDRFGESVAIGDLDADGDLDIAAGAPEYSTSFGRAYVFYQDGSWPAASSADETIAGASGYYYGRGIAVGDINFDGRDDLVIGYPNYNTTSGGMSIIFNDGSYPSSRTDADINTSGFYQSMFSKVLLFDDMTGDGRPDLIVGAPNSSTNYGTMFIFEGMNLQCEPPTLDSIAISDTSGFTNDSTPSITLTYSGGGADPDYMQFSCNGGTNWSSEIAYASPTSSFNITNGATGCTSTNESKTITARVRSALCGYSDTASDSTYYDTTGPSVSISSAVNDSISQITVTAGTPDDGSGIGSGGGGWEYYHGYYTSSDCTTGGPTTDGWQSENQEAFVSLWQNTQFSFEVTARDGFDNAGSASDCVATYTSACTPDTPGHTSQQTTSMRWTWDSGCGTGDPSYQKDFMYGDDGGDGCSVDDCDTGPTANYYWDESTLSADTQYTRCSCARNEDDDKTDPLTIGPYYTSANTPGTPTFSNEAQTTIDVDPVSGGSETQMAIYVADSDLNCDGSSGHGYVQYDGGGSGGLLGSESWATDANWTTDFTVTGLSAGTEYYFCVKAENGDGDDTAFGVSDSTSTLASPPAYTTLTISDTSGFTNSSNPSMTYSGLSGGTPTQHKYSCNNSDWSGYTSYENPTTDFAITSSLYGCNGTTNETKTVYVILNNTGGDSSAQSDSTYYDNTGPTASISSAVNDSASQITVTAGTPDDGSGIGSPWDYGFYRYNSGDCTIYNHTEWVNDPDNSAAFQSLSANTEYSFKVKAADGLDNWGILGACAATYTSANTPTTPGHTSQATTSMRWTWASGGSQNQYTYGTTNSCGSSPTSNTYWDEGSLSADTQYTRYACATNNDGDETTGGDALTIQFYTSANPPANPAYDTGYIAVDSMRWTWDSGGSQTSYEIDDTDDCASPYVPPPSTNYYDDTTTTLPNTSYSRYICALNGDGDLTSDIVASGHTLADPPTADSPDHTNAVDSITFDWVEPAGGGGANGYTFSVNDDCSGGTLIPSDTYYQDNSCSSANTAYTRYVCSRNNEAWVNDDDPLTIGPYYTSANTPGTPTVSNATSATLDVNPVSGGAESSMAIYVEQGSTCDGADGEGYLHSDGSISNIAPEWQTDGEWDTTTAIGLTASTQYAFCAKAKNGDGDETGFNATAGTGTTLAAPAFTEGPSDGGSSTTTPTDEGSNVTFTAKSNNGGNYWLLICNNGNAPTVGSPPECNGGAGNRIARSAETATNVEASDTHDTTGESSESYAWYAFVCDAGSCSSSAQGTGDNGSPYEVNHRPEIGTVNIGDTTGGTGTIEAGEDVFFNVVVTDTDTSGGADTIDMHVCQTNSFTPGSGCDSNQTICATTGNASGVNAECDSGDLSGDLSGTYNDIGTSAGQKTVYIFLEDNHDFEDADTNTQNYTVANSAPAFTIEPSDGDPWTSQTVTTYWQDIDFADADDGWIIGGAGVINHSDDGGDSWSSQTSGVTESLSAVSFVSTTTGWVVGRDDGVGGDAVILKTINGSSWSGQTSGTTNDLNAVHAVSSTVAYAVGAGGTFLKTADGSTWGSQDGNSGTWINGIYCTDANTCWAVGNSGTVRYTTNGGSTQWSSGTGASGQLNAVYFASSSVGWAVGSSGVLYKSVNSGANWSSQTSGTTETLYDIHCTDTSTCWAAGANGTIITTTDGGTNWKAQRSGTTDGLFGIDFYDNATAWVSGANLVLQGAYGSSNAYPTNADDNVSFKTTATDDNDNDYYLLICKTSSAPTPSGGDGDAPECDGGSGNRWAVSSSTASDSEATAIFTTDPADSQQNIWYAFVCDAADCSSNSQGVGNSGTPFEVNHRPAIGAITIGPSYGSGASVDPGNGGTGAVYFQVGVTDADSAGTADTVDLYVCSTDSFTPGSGCGGQVYCFALDEPSGDAECGDADLAPIPTSHGTKTVYIFIQDSHDFEDDDGTHNQTYSVTDVAPVLTSYSTTDTLSISAGGYDTMSYSVALYDNNGDNDVTDLEMVFFEDTSVNNDCSADDNDCVIENIAGNCTFTGQGAGSDKDLGADCDFTVWFNATASSNWEVHAKPTDGLGQETGFADSNDNNVIASLQGVTAVEESIAYGTIEIGRSSDGKTVNVGNVGNQVIDILVDGDDMCIDSYSASCPSTYVPLEQQKWHHSSSTFNWGDAETGAGPWILEDTASTGGDTDGCLNRDIQIRDGHSETYTNEAFYWKILIPASQAAGSYYGVNSVTATPSSSCSGTLY